MPRWIVLVLILLPVQERRGANRIVAAFYDARWDAATGENMRHPDGRDALEDHPEGFRDFTYRSADWHRKNLQDMDAARIDIALCEFPASEPAVKALVEALEKMETDRKSAPRVAPVSADPAQVLAFLAKVPARFRYSVEAAPMVWLQAGSHASGEALAKFRAAFAGANGGQLPFVVAEKAWGEPDLVYAPGGAFSGPPDFDVVTLGPGFREGPVRVRERAEGAWYERSWYIAMKLHPRIVAIESWNRFHQASGVCETKEYKRGYIDVTRQYAEKFHAGGEIGRPKGKYSESRRLVWNLKFDPPDGGLKPLEVEGGKFDIVEAAGWKMLTTQQTAGTQRRILAFSVDDSFALFERRHYEIEIEILDKGKGNITLEYDSETPKLKGPAKWHKAAEPQAFTDSGDWKTFTFKMSDAAFGNRQDGGSDLRFITEKRGLSVRWALLR